MKLAVAVVADPGNFTTVIYQAGGGQLFWLDVQESDLGMFLGTIEQQGSLSALPAARRPAARAKSKR
jgi:hypothetical protein